MIADDWLPPSRDASGHFQPSWTAPLPAPVALVADAVVSALLVVGTLALAGMLVHALTRPPEKDSQ